MGGRSNGYLYLGVLSVPTSSTLAICSAQPVDLVNSFQFTKSTVNGPCFCLWWLISRCWVQTFSGWWFEIFFYFHPYLGKWSHLTNIFQMGWNHQLVLFIFTRNLGEHDPNLTSIVSAIGLGWKQQPYFCWWGLKKKHQGCARDVRESMQFTCDGFEPFPNWFYVSSFKRSKAYFVALRFLLNESLVTAPYAHCSLLKVVIEWVFGYQETTFSQDIWSTRDH